jgi:3-dehydroquinate synthase
LRNIKVCGSTGESRIIVGESIDNLLSYVDSEKMVIITDVNVRKLYGGRFPGVPCLEIGVGEKIKNLDTVEKIYDFFLENSVDRSSFIVGIGGGIVCDITGFAASTYLRGIPFGFVSTTLLAQVDASIGGKNGVNFKGFKNMIGTFSQPRFVICDMETLKTLPERELRCGFAEIVKHASIADDSYFSYIENHVDSLIALDGDCLEKVLFDSLVIKSEIVNKDEKETGERRKLNFGHTLGHAVEKVLGFNHGEAVSIGMAAASDFSVSLGNLEKSDADRLKDLLLSFNLPISINGDMKTIVDTIDKDKKREGESIHFVLLDKIGKAVVRRIRIDELKNFFSSGNRDN